MSTDVTNPEQLAEAVTKGETPVERLMARTLLGWEELDDERLERDGWHIDSLADADWVLKRLADLRAEVEENKRIEEAAIARIKLKTQALNNRVERGVCFFESKLRDYAEQHRVELLKGGKKKSRSLLHGTLGWRKVGGQLRVVDPDALMQWAVQQPVENGFVRIKEEPAIDEIKRHFKTCGEVPPGMDVTPESEDFFVKPAEGAGDDSKH